MITPKHRYYFTHSLSYAIKKLTNTTDKVYDNLSVQEVVELSKDLSERDLFRVQGVGKKSIQRLFELRTLINN
tara:strand:- start:356 stop:574 length:219 start_codon:yes stop_codon:yes gene_type:complete